MKSTHPVRISKSPIFLFALLCLVLWWSALFGLAYFTSNPPTLNLRQIRQAQYLVTARIINRESGLINIEKEWKKNKDWKELKIADLPEDAPLNELLLIPISPQNGKQGWEVTRAILIVKQDVHRGFLIPYDGIVQRGQGTVSDLSEGSKTAVEKGSYLKEGDLLQEGIIELAKFSPAIIYPATEEVLKNMQELLTFKKD